MSGMTVTRYGQEAYSMHKGVDPDGMEFELRVYASGMRTIRVRPGEFATDRRWSPEVELAVESC